MKLNSMLLLAANTIIPLTFLTLSAANLEYPPDLIQKDNSIVKKFETIKPVVMCTHNETAADQSTIYVGLSTGKVQIRREENVRNESRKTEQLFKTKQVVNPFKKENIAWVNICAANNYFIAASQQHGVYLYQRFNSLKGRPLREPKQISYEYAGYFSIPEILWTCLNDRLSFISKSTTEIDVYNNEREELMYSFSNGATPFKICAAKDMLFAGYRNNTILSIDIEKHSIISTWNLLSNTSMYEINEGDYITAFQHNSTAGHPTPLFVASTNGTIAAVDLRAKKIAAQTNFGNSVFNIALSRNNRFLLAIGNNNNKIKVWDLLKNNPDPFYIYEHEQPILDIAIGNGSCFSTPTDIVENILVIQEAEKISIHPLRFLQ